MEGSGGVLFINYFVSGLSGLQYMLPAAVEKLRLPVSAGLPDFWVLSWEDPANFLRFLSGDGLDNTEDSKVYGDFIVFQAGTPVLTVTGKKLKLTLVQEKPLELLKRALEELLKILGLVIPTQKLPLPNTTGNRFKKRNRRLSFTSWALKKVIKKWFFSRPNAK